MPDIQQGPYPPRPLQSEYEVMMTANKQAHTDMRELRAAAGQQQQEALPQGAAQDPWKHRSQGMQCTTCMWFVVKEPGRRVSDRVLGRCRRHAPTMNGYPVVFATDFCGDHKLDENKL